ncbi:MAG: hypothetical protein V7K14_25420 [Nostoc sp.]|uniref:hypothetical protein n=1 Tax=Nostoc sp. TaxID=1180 RepID=UPI002FF5AB12
MLNTKEHLNQLDAIAVTELDNETAAAIGGGYNIEFYDTNNYKELLGSFNNSGKPVLINNDKISSIIVRGGKWRLYADAYYQGFAKTYGKGKYVLPAGLNNKVSSFIRVG